MRGAVLILICTIVLTNGASLDIQNNRNFKVTELLRDDGSSEIEDTIFHNNGDPSQAAAICAAAESTRTLIAHEICNRYYICVGSLPVTMRCPPFLLFDHVSMQCDWPHNVECGDRIISDETDEEGNAEEDEVEENDEEGSGEEDEVAENEKNPNSDPSQAPAICAAKGSDDVLVASEVCNRFYICSGGRPVSMNCPENLLYNYNTEQCDWPENVKCGDRIISYEPEDSGSGEEGSGDIEDIETIVNGTNWDPSKAPAICRVEESDGILVAHEYCNYFYICSSFTPVSMPCPHGLLYNWKKEQCDWAYNVHCGNRVIYEPEDLPETDGSGDEDESDVENDGGNNDPSQAKDICAAPGSDGTLVAGERCNQFYNCWNGRPVLQDCPTNLYFNARFNYCDWPENVRCDRP